MIIGKDIIDEEYKRMLIVMLKMMKVMLYLIITVKIKITTIDTIKVIVVQLWNYNHSKKSNIIKGKI